MKDPESIAPINQNQPNWMTNSDKEFLDGIDETVDEYLSVSSHLEDVIQEIPRYENPIKMLANLRMVYGAYKESEGEEREAFVESVIESANDPEATDSQRGAMLEFLAGIDRFGLEKDDDSDLLTA